MARHRPGNNTGLNSTIMRRDLKAKRPQSAQQLLANAAASAQKASKLTPAEQELLAIRQARRAGHPPGT